MYESKIVMAPIGYGEMAVRDIESASFGSVLIKPDMSYIYSKPFVYEDGETYIACKYDWSDVEEKIDYVLLMVVDIFVVLKIVKIHQDTHLIIVIFINIYIYVKKIMKIK